MSSTTITGNIAHSGSPPTITFPTGAQREDFDDKPDYEGFISPLVVQEFGAYMHRHRIRPDGTKRASDNWQKGIPLDSYIKSLLRHLLDLWLHHRGFGGRAREDTKDALCGILFNAQGYLHELLKSELNRSRQHPATSRANTLICERCNEQEAARIRAGCMMCESCYTKYLMTQQEWL